MKSSIGDFLKILELISFDDTLFKKEFCKTLNWISKEDYPEIEAWMKSRYYATDYPELLDHMR